MNATYTARKNALTANLKRLQEKNPEAGKDVIAMLYSETSPFYFSEAINKKIDAWGIDTSGIFNDKVNPKVTKRFVQFVGAVHHEQFKDIDRTSACILLALHLAGDFPLTTGALWEVATGGKVRSEGMGENRRGVSVRTVARLVGAVGVSTVGTQLSRSVGKNGFLNFAGATTGEPGKVNQSVTLNRENPLFTAFLDLMSKATEKQIDEMVRDK